jgi:esterase/lipase superfamily enzyme
MTRPSLHRTPRVLCLVLAGAGLTACQKTMMQTPALFDGAEIDPFARFDEAQKTNEILIFYATNRPAGGSVDDRSYKNGIRDDVAVGEATVRLGSKNMTWEELYEASTTVKRKKSIPLYLENATEMAVIGAEESPERPSPEALAFAERINSALAGKEWRDITIYLHGAKVGFYDSCVTAAEFHHFMGRHGVMLNFDWPSTQSVITYGTDVKHAGMSVPAFVRFVEFLARNTDADRINMIGYSCGAQIASPAMYELREKYSDYTADQLQDMLRIGEVYLAAPDIDLRTFAVDHLPRYHDMTVSTTLTINLHDSVLALSQMAHGGSRAGRPDIKELTEEETEMIAGLAVLPTFNVIDMGTSQPPTEANLKGHGYWYKSPWVSTDIIIQFIFHASPAERGLEIVDAKERPVWYYPDDYPQRVISRLLAYLATLDEGDPRIPRSRN